MINPLKDPSQPVQAQTRSKQSLKAQTALVLLLVLNVVCLEGPRAAFADPLPQAGQVVSGAVAIQSNGQAMQVTQGGPTAIVNWDSFSVGAGHQVTFVQPGKTSAILNRVTGHAASDIAGHVSANGQVYLVNPNGIAIGPDGTVRTEGGFIASTLDIADDDFLAGRGNFKGKGASATVRNDGLIEVGQGGYAALIGGKVRNDGLISVPLAKVGLGAGEEAVLDFSGDGFLQVAVPSNTADEEALIDSKGKVSASGGRIVVSAATARQAARQAINLSGVVEAKSVGGRNGSISIGGGAGGTVKLKGRVDVSSATGKGGTVKVTGKTIELRGAVVDASGEKGGGVIRLGGGRQGGEGIAQSENLSLDSASTVSANAFSSGDGGDIVLWSDRKTDFSGQVSARGALDGRGGDAEVSGKFLLTFDGLVDLTAQSGRYGNLLLDPYNIVILNQSSSGVNGFTPSSNDSVISTRVLSDALQNANVTISTGGEGSAGNQDGTITLGADLTWSTTSILTLSAYRDIILNANMAGGAGSQVVLRADNAGRGIGTVDIASGKQITATGGVSVYYSPTNKDSSSINTDSFSNLPDYQAYAGAGTTIDGYALVNTVYDLQNIANNKSARFALGRDIDASATHGWSGGFQPIGGNRAMSFSGILDGQGHVIQDLYIGQQAFMGYGSTGLFGSTQSGSVIRNVGLVNVEVEARSSNDIGALVGFHAGRIENAYSTGSVKSAGIADGYAYNTGGLVGVSLGSIENSYSTAEVTSGLSVGGLVGVNSGTITGSYATGKVTGTDKVGGLAGRQDKGSIRFSRASGDVVGEDDVGGLVGLNSGLIEQSYASGSIEASGQSAGGLVGANVSQVIGGITERGSILQSFARGGVEGNTEVGGLVGRNEASVLQAYAEGAVTGDNRVGGLVGHNAGWIDQTHSRGPVEGNSEAGGLVGVSNGGVVSSSYFDRDGTGQSSSAGGVSLSQLQMQDPSRFAGFDGAVWALAPASSYPALYGVSGRIGIRQTAIYGDRPVTEIRGLNFWTALTGAIGGVTTRTNVGRYEIDLSRLNGFHKGGEQIELLSLGATVSARAVTITANNQTRTIGAANPAFTYSISGMGLVNGDVLSGALASAAITTSPAGSYAITRGSLSASPNYTLQYQGATFTIRAPSPGTTPVPAPAPPPLSPLEQELGSTPTGVPTPDKGADQIVIDFISGVQDSSPSQNPTEPQTPDQILLEQILIKRKEEMRAQALAEARDRRDEDIGDLTSAADPVRSGAAQALAGAVVTGAMQVAASQVSVPVPGLRGR